MARVRRRDRADAAEGRHGDGARPRREDGATKARARCSTSSPIPTIRSRTTRRTGPEIWRDTEGRITHFVSSMGTTGTIMGCSRFLKEKNPAIQIIGCQPDGRLADSGHPQMAGGLSAENLRRSARGPGDQVSQADAEEMTRRLAREEGIFAGISSGGAVHVALRISRGGQERGDRHHHLRPRRPLSVDGDFPGLSCGPESARKPARH